MTLARPDVPTRFALVGAGNVGTAVSELLVRRGHRVEAVFSRSPESAHRAADRLGAEVAGTLDALPDVDAVLIGAPDPALEEVAARLADAKVGAGSYVHFAGAVGVAPLGVLVDRGGAAAALHPVQACPDVDTAVRHLPGSAWGVTTSTGAEVWGDEFVRAVGGVPIRVADEDRPLWHAAAVTTSNGIAGLLSLGEAMLAAIGIEEPGRILGPLATGALENARSGGGGGATMTGPVVRGDSTAVDLHLETLATKAPELSHGYLLAVRTILAAAIRAGRVDAATAARIEGALSRFEPESVA